jgi:predicted MFS family arabinose efflux permease
LLYAWVGPAWCFLINAFSYLAVIIALLLMKIDPAPVKARVKSAAQDLKEGLRYVGLHEIIRTMVLVTIVVSLFGMAYVTLMPAWAVDVLGGNAATNGLMQSARGLGAMFGALLIAALGNFHWRGKLLSISMFAFPVLLLAFSFVTWTPLSLLVLVGIGFSFMVLFNLINIVLQGLVTDELRGRVMSVYMLTIFGGMPLGALWAGALAEQIGEPLTVVIGAVISLIFAGFVYWKIPKVRQLQ